MKCLASRRSSPGDDRDLGSKSLWGRGSIGYQHQEIPQAQQKELLQCRGGATPRRCQLFGSGSVLGSCFWVKNLPRFLEPVLEPSSVRCSVFMRSPECFLDIPQYPQFWSIFINIPWFSRSFWSVLLEPYSVLEPVLEPVPEPSSVRFSVLPSCQEPYFSLCHGLFQRVQILTLRFRHRSIPPSYRWRTQPRTSCLGSQPHWQPPGQAPGGGQSC